MRELQAKLKRQTRSDISSDLFPVKRHGHGGEEVCVCVWTVCILHVLETLSLT
jgi:hypothetical protein